VPIAVQGLVWYYNKALLTQAGLDPEKPPATWQDFLDACEAMKKIGKAGVAVGEKEGFWASWFLNSIYFQTFEPGDQEKLTRGEMKWTDPKVTRLLEKLKELNDRGCFQKGAMSTPLFPDAGEAFMRGEAAFFLGLISDVAHWKEFADMMGVEKVGVMPCPVFQPGPNAAKFPTGGAFAYAITKWAKQPGVAFEYIAFIASDENANTFLSDVGSFPANQSYDRSLMKDPNAKTIAGWLAAGKTGPQMTGAVPMEVDQAVLRECQRLLSGQTDVAGAAEAIESAAAAARSRRH
jgi:multiple sugar transport system substrate-binding protein